MSPIIVSDSGGGTFTPHPEGQFAALCVDVVDVGWKATDWGPKYKVRFSFYCGETLVKTIDGKDEVVPQIVSSTFNGTLSERGKLRPFLESWRGQMFTSTELGKFDLENVLGAPAFISIVHVVKGSDTYANVRTIMQLPPNMTAPDRPANFERVQDREGWTGPNPHPDRETTSPATGEPLPQDTTDYDEELPF